MASSTLLRVAVLAAALRAASPQLMAQMGWSFNEPAEYPGFTLTYNQPALPDIAENHTKYGIEVSLTVRWPHHPSVSPIRFSSQIRPVATPFALLHTQRA